MKLSMDRILTTHVGSLPRPQALVDLLVKKDQDQPYHHADSIARSPRRSPRSWRTRSPSASMS